jgi:nucleotide-binding universal stress UspA family protein
MTTEPDPAAPSGVVVGVDGSRAGTAALHWAADTAATYQAPLTIVFARPDVEGDVVEAEQEEQLLDRSACDVREHQPELVVTDVRVRFRHGRGRPAGILVDEAHGCALAVVGARGLGGFVGLLMGSVSQQVLAHADCPVAVVRPPVSE